MRQVIHVISGLKVGGAETVLLRLIASSRGAAYSHSVVALTPGGGMGERFAAAGIDVMELDFKKRPVGDFLRLVKRIRSARPDIVQTWMYHADLIGGIAARLVGVRNVIWGVRTTDVTAGRGKAIAMLRSLCASSSSIIPRAIVCAAEASLRSHAQVGYDAGRMTVVPNGFDFGKLRRDPSARAMLRAQCGFAPRHLVVGTLGRFDAAKDPENFVRAAGLFAAERPDARFLLVGRDMLAGNSELGGWIAATGYPDRFVLLGERSDVAACLGAMDIFCLSSRTEGFPNVLAEAMAMQLPCVTTDVGDAAMLLGGTGAVVPKENAQALAAGMRSLAELPAEERRRAGEQASQRVRAEFSVERMRNRFETIYNAITK